MVCKIKHISQEKNNRKAHREHSGSAKKYAPRTYGGRKGMWKGTGKGNCNNALKTNLKAKDHESGNAGEKKRQRS